jgi:DNA-binding transcriptional LysR family regulator
MGAKMRPVLDWDDLRYLLAVRRAGSLNAAARSLGVDKATVSRRIAAAEEALGVRVFDRKPDGYELTPHGERALDAVADIDQTVAGLVSELTEARGDKTGIVHVTVPQFFASHVLLPALPAFRAAHPGIDVVLNASSAVANMAQREAEVGLRNVKPDQQSVTVKRVGMLGSAVYGSRAYIEARGAPAGPRDLPGHELVGWDRGFTFVAQFHWIGESGARVPVRVNDAAVLCHAVEAGLGLGVLPCLLGDERPGLVRLDVFGRGREDIYAVAPGELRRAGRVRAVIDLLVDTWGANATRLAGDPR